MTLRDAARGYLFGCRAKGLAERTIEFYESWLRHFTEAHQEVALEDVTTPLIREYVAGALARTSPTSTRHAYRTLSAFYHWLQREEWVVTNPVAKVEPPRVPPVLVHPFTEEEITRILETASPRSFLGARLTAMVLLLIDTGLRNSALIGLDLEDVDLAGGIIRHSFATMFLRGGGNVFSLQQALGHTTLVMTRRYVEIVDADLLNQHRQASPGDKFLPQVQKGAGRKRLR